MKHAELLSVRDLHVQVGEKEILHGVNLSVGTDETHVLLGPNGTGKSTLGYAITGNPAYQVTRGSITFDGEDITSMPVNERAKKGVFLSFQNPLEVPGVTLSAFIRTALEQKSGSRIRLRPVRPGDLVRGHVVLGETDAGTFVVHRIIRVEASHIVLLGDGNVAGTETIPRERIYGIVDCGPLHLQLARIWLWMRPVRKYPLWILRKICRK